MGCQQSAGVFMCLHYWHQPRNQLFCEQQSFIGLLNVEYLFDIRKQKNKLTLIVGKNMSFSLFQCKSHRDTNGRTWSTKEGTWGGAGVILNCTGFSLSLFVCSLFQLSAITCCHSYLESLPLSQKEYCYVATYHAWESGRTTENAVLLS